MPTNPDPSARYDLASALRDKNVLARLAVIGGALLCLVACFAYVAGWLSPGRLTPARIIDGFQQVNGLHEGFRRNHPKGLCIAGNFQSNGNGVRLSKAAVFRPGQVPVIGRLALAGGQPYAADEARGVRSMALSFRPPGAEEWRTGMNDIPVFPVATAEEFYELLLSGAPDPATGKPDPEKTKAFVAAHPKTAHALQAIAAGPHPSGFADATYNSLDAFRFVDADGRSTPVRWAMVAAEGAPAADAAAGAADKNYLFDQTIAAIGRAPLHWHLVATIGRPGDPTDDATAAWPEDREHVDLGTLTIDHAEAEAAGNCRDLNFDPLVLPAGIEPSDDPLLSARSAAYARSFTRREGEKKQPSAVQTPHADKGA